MSRTQMTHILESLTYKMEGQPPQKNRSDGFFARVYHDPCQIWMGEWIPIPRKKRGLLDRLIFVFGCLVFTFFSVFYRTIESVVLRVNHAEASHFNP